MGKNSRNFYLVYENMDSISTEKNIWWQVAPWTVCSGTICLRIRFLSEQFGYDAQTVIDIA